MNGPGEEFWEKARKARRPLLALDYDGTLAPFQTDRMAAVPLPGVTETIESIILDTPTIMAVISGRPLFELDRLMGPVSSKMVAIGSHGWEWRDAEANLRPAGLDADTDKRLEKARFAALESGAKRLGDDAEKRIERKAASVAAHVRGLDSNTADAWLSEIRTSWDALSVPVLEVMEFDGGLEIRSAERNKGRAMTELLAFTGGPDFPVYVGDDLTDEDAFRALPEHGAGIKVGDGRTAAGYRLEDCEAVKTFLKKWASLLKPR